jgi:hypothetical protein
MTRADGREFMRRSAAAWGTAHAAAGADAAVAAETAARTGAFYAPDAQDTRS